MSLKIRRLFKIQGTKLNNKADLSDKLNVKLILLLIFSITAHSNCLEDYQKSYETKMSKYKAKMKRYRANRSNGLLSNSIIMASIASVLEPPTKEHIFEEEVLRSAGLISEYDSKAVTDIHKKLRPIHPFIDSKTIKDEFKKGLDSGVFCRGIFGKFRIDRAKKYVLKQLKSKRDIAISSDPHIYDGVNKKESSQFNTHGSKSRDTKKK